MFEPKRSTFREVCACVWVLLKNGLHSVKLCKRHSVHCMSSRRKNTCNIACICKWKFQLNNSYYLEPIDLLAFFGLPSVLFLAFYRSLSHIYTHSHIIYILFFSPSFHLSIYHFFFFLSSCHSVWLHVQLYERWSTSVYLARRWDLIREFKFNEFINWKWWWFIVRLNFEKRFSLSISHAPFVCDCCCCW